jgi:hypothetical protein
MSLLLALALASGTIPAPASGAPDEIIVEGNRSSKSLANKYLDGVLPSSFDFQPGRFEDRLCLGVVGLPDKLKSEVEARVQRVARATNVGLAESGCRPNFLIIVVDDKKAMIEGMWRQKQSYLYGVGEAAERRLASEPGPVAAWQVSEVIGADGIPLQVDRDGIKRMFSLTQPSRVTTTTRTRLLGSVVVIEQKALVDVTTTQLADFALVRGLTPIEPQEHVAPGSSVLSLFNGTLGPEDAPQSLTWWDLAFLKALADTNSDRVASIQRHEIRDKMLKEMAKIPAAER